jgi:hypothetical protein
MSENIVMDKAYKFALRIVALYKHLSEEKKEFVLSKFVLASGTQIGARIEIAQEAESRSGFIHEMGMPCRNPLKRGTGCAFCSTAVSSKSRNSTRSSLTVRNCSLY